MRNNGFGDMTIFKLSILNQEVVTWYLSILYLIILILRYFALSDEYEATSKF